MLQITLENTDFMQRAISSLKEGMDDATLNDIGEVMGKAMGTFAPYDPHGDGVHLRDDYKIDFYKNAVGVTWGYKRAPTEAYAHFQDEGYIYDDNYVKWAQGPDKRTGAPGVQIGWVSSPRPKKRSDRMMGTARNIRLKDGRLIHIDGYSTPGTGPHWIEEARKTSTVYNPMRRKIYEMLADAIGEKIVGKRYYT